MKPLDIGDDQGSVAGSAFAVALGRAFNKGNISEAGVEEFFNDLQQALEALNRGSDSPRSCPTSSAILSRSSHSA